MSTLHKLFTPRELEEFAADLTDWPNAESGDNDLTVAVSPFTTFYFNFNPDEYISTSDAMIEIHEKFEEITGKSFKISTNPHSERPHPYPSKKPFNLRDYARKTPLDKTFTFNLTDELNHRTSPSTAGYFWRDGFWGENSNTSYSSIQLTYRWQWWLTNRDKWKTLLLDAIEKINPSQVYSGFAVITPLEFGTRSGVATWERALSEKFYGLDIDYPLGMHALDTGLTHGIRPPTWGFFLSDEWRSKLGLSQHDVHEALDYPGISVDACSTGQWIELGTQPSLYPIDRGVPELPVILNRLLRPIRHGSLDLIGMGQWDGDPNERFSVVDAQRWMARFDDTSEWPSSNIRQLNP